MATRRLSNSNEDGAAGDDVVAGELVEGGDVSSEPVAPVVVVDKMSVDGLTTVIQVRNQCSY